MRLTNKVAIITGAASGICRASASLFAVEGAKVVVADIDDAGGEQTVSSIRAGGGEAVFIHADVSRASEVEYLVAVGLDRFSKIDIMFNNAGVFMKQTAVEDVEESLWDRILSINVKGVFFGVKYVVPVMKKAGGGVIINTASMVGVMPSPYLSTYASSKGAIIAFTKSVALELAPYHIRANCVCPTLTDTPMIRPMIAADAQERRQPPGAPSPLAKLARPEDIAYAALYLASDESSMLSGTCIEVNGGQKA
jgi:3-oxoacyl-[acyl-carrier protein] reductase